MSNGNQWVEDFRNKKNKLLQGHNFDLSQNSPIFHYTSLDSFKEIIKSQTFLFTHYKDLNDTKELEYGFNIFEQIINKLKIPDRENFLLVARKILLEDSVSFYISSFSEQPDNLTLWKGYAVNAKGVAIGIDRNFPLINETIYETPIVAEAVYNKKYIENNFTLLCNRIITITSSHQFTRLSSNERNIIITDLNRELMLYSLLLSLVIKNEAFIDEREVRLVLKDGKKSFLSAKPNGYFFHKDRFNNPSEKRSVISSQLEKTFLKSIMLGPCTTNSDLEEIKKVLIESNYCIENIQISKSEIPYRG